MSRGRPQFDPRTASRAGLQRLMGTQEERIFELLGELEEMLEEEG